MGGEGRIRLVSRTSQRLRHTDDSDPLSSLRLHEFDGPRLNAGMGHRHNPSGGVGRRYIVFPTLYRSRARGWRINW